MGSLKINKSVHTAQKRSSLTLAAISLCVLILVFDLENTLSAPTQPSQPTQPKRYDPTRNESSSQVAGSTDANDDVLARILNESANTIQSNPENFVSEELPAEEIMRMFGSVNESETSHQGETSVQNDNMLDASSQQNLDTETPPEQEPTTSTLDPLLYLESEDEFQHLLETIKNDMANSKDHPANFVKDDEELEFLSSHLDDNEEDMIKIRLERWEKNLPLVFEVKECPICREISPLDEGIFEKLLCGHTFHRKCLDDYIRAMIGDIPPTVRFSCPMCRTNVIRDN